MAVYTQIGQEQLAQFLQDYDVGELISFSGIAQGVENSNYRVETTSGPYILTLYEKRVAETDLPFFVALMDHAAAQGVAMPGTISDRGNISIKQLCGKPACLIEFMAGNTIAKPNADLAYKGGVALGQFHQAMRGFSMTRTNSMGPDEWQRLADICAPKLHNITPEKPIELMPILSDILRHWPSDLPQSTIHADLFPDNVMVQGGEVSAIIDVYFACTDFRAYDLAVMHSAWCFSDDGLHFDADISQQLLSGYGSVISLDPQEISALPILCRGASLRFFLSRAYDWLHTAPDAMVTRKDPMAYWHRLEFYGQEPNHALFAKAFNHG